MFNIKIGDEGHVELTGRFDASKSKIAKEVFDEIKGTTKVDFKDLYYISSAGLGILLVTQKRLNNSGNELLLINMNDHLREIFKYAGFDMIFKIDQPLA